MKINTQRVIGAGAPIVDIIVHLTEEELAAITPLKGNMAMVDAATQDRAIAARPVHMALGGSASNTVVALARLGIESALWGKVGLDMYGQFFCQSFFKEGALLEKLMFTDKLPTARCVSMVTPDAERTMFSNLAASTDPQNEEISPEVFANFGIVHIEGYMLHNQITAKLMHAAKAAGAKVSFDLGAVSVVESFKSEILELLEQYVDIVFANELESTALWGKIPVNEQLKFFGELCSIAVIKLGAQGSIARWHDQTICNGEALRVQAIDTTGAGDLFQAGFLYGLLKGADVKACLHYGAVLGAEIVQTPGAVIPDDRWRSIKEKLEIKG